MTPRRYYVRSPDGGFGGWDSGRHGLDYDLIEAIKKGHVALVHAFLAKGASANATDRRGAPALMWAIGSGHEDCVRLLLKSGADANVRDTEGLGALALARRKNRPDLLEILLAAGAMDSYPQKSKTEDRRIGNQKYGSKIHGFFQANFMLHRSKAYHFTR